MAKKRSAGLLLYRKRNRSVEVFLVHPGGPFWAKKDDGSWSIPKGEYEDGDDPFEIAQREFTEETGFSISGQFVSLKAVRQPSGKIVSAWAIEGDVDPAQLRSNTFRMEWPPKSGEEQEFPEVDRGDWFALPHARRKMLPGQTPFLDELAMLLGEAVPATVSSNTPTQGSLFS